MLALLKIIAVFCPSVVKRNNGKQNLEGRVKSENCSTLLSGELQMKRAFVFRIILLSLLCYDQFSMPCGPVCL